MKDPAASQGTLRDLLRTNKLAILLELAIMFVPLYVLLAINGRSGGDDFTPLGGGLALAGGPLVNLGLVLVVATFLVVSRIRGTTLSDFGLGKPSSWVRTILLGLAVAVGMIVVFALLLALIQLVIPIPQQDVSRFAFLRGNLPNLIVNLVAMWLTAGFFEELLWRGYLMNRLVDLQGNSSKIAWAIALVGSAIIFGLGHTYQGLGGVVKVSVAGLLFGAAFLLLRRNLWPVVIAHGLVDTMSFVQHYFGQ